MTGPRLATLADFVLERIAADETILEATGVNEPYLSRLLAGCESRRRTVNLHSVVPVAPVGHDARLMVCLGCGDLAPCPTVRLLAVPYAGHPDYPDYPDHRTGRLS